LEKGWKGRIRKSKSEGNMETMSGGEKGGEKEDEWQRKRKRGVNG